MIVLLNILRLQLLLLLLSISILCHEVTQLVLRIVFVVFILFTFF